MRPFYYHHSAGRLCAFASEPGAILLLHQIPYRLNEGRIADFLVNPLEGIDKTSTFFQDVVRLPPAHTLAATRDGMKLRRYWQPRAGPELRLRSDDAYAEAFLAVFTRAVQCRLRAPEALGSMLSGGIDSGSVVTVARTLLAEAGEGPLHTFSATGSDPGACIETRTIEAAQTMAGIAPHTVSHGRMRSLVPALWPLTWGLDEPFDNHMTLQRAVYLDARNCGRKVVLDGVGGDVVLSGGPRVARLLREGRWVAAYREARGTNLYFGRKHLPLVDLCQGARSAFIPQWLRDVRKRCDLSLERRHLAAKMRESVISPEFAKRVGLAERLRALDAHQPPGLTAGDREGLAAEIDHPFLTVGRERYDRVASAVSIEPRDPFLDLRVVEFCLTLPAAQRQRDGWPKVILRHAMAGRLSEAVRWRRGKEHLGGEFTRAFMDAAREAIRVDMEENQSTIASYVDLDAVGRASRSYSCSGDPAQAERFYDAAHLASWLRRFGERPSPAMRRSTGREGIPDQHEARKT
jgi:asparagine synthase (glutamine-hydrolysing)